MDDVKHPNSATEDLTPIDLAGIVGGVARRVPGTEGRSTDSMLAVYKDRCTYTFILDAEVASIHFDANRKSIFFRGHNVRFMTMEPAARAALASMCDILAADRDGRELLSAYRETLDELPADNLK